jgi:hypothetical protein
LNCRGKIDSKFPADAGFLCSNTFAKTAVLRDMIKLQPCIFAYNFDAVKV